MKNVENFRFMIKIKKKESVKELNEGEKYVDFPTSNKICRDNTGGDIKCKEIQLCETVTLEEGIILSDSDCNEYSVSKINITTHICLKDPKENKCFEQYLCGSIQYTKNEIVCSDYPVKKENTGTHICVTNSKGDIPCIEEEKK